MFTVDSSRGIDEGHMLVSGRGRTSTLLLHHWRRKSELNQRPRALLANSCVSFPLSYLWLRLCSRAGGKEAPAVMEAEKDK